MKKHEACLNCPVDKNCLLQDADIVECCDGVEKHRVEMDLQDVIAATPKHTVGVVRRLG